MPHMLGIYLALNNLLKQLVKRCERRPKICRNSLKELVNGCEGKPKISRNLSFFFFLTKSVVNSKVGFFVVGVQFSKCGGEKYNQFFRSSIMLLKNIHERLKNQTNIKLYFHWEIFCSSSLIS